MVLLLLLLLPPPLPFTTPQIGSLHAHEPNVSIVIYDLGAGFPQIPHTNRRK